MSSAVDLTPAEFHLAAAVGLLRHTQSNMRGDRDALVAFDLVRLKGTWIESLAANIYGAAGELAYCRSVNRHWPGTVDAFRARADVGDRVEIRSTSKLGAPLKVRPQDRPRSIFVLVEGAPPSFSVVGWITTERAREIGRYADPGDRGKPAWWIDQSDLEPFA